jgi:dTDP-4-dehydrorhamnose reductase
MIIVLFGSTGMLGRYVYNILKNEYNIICIKRNDFDIENDNWSKLNYIIESNLKENDVIINCAGIIPQKYQNDNYKTYIRVNTLFPHKLNEISKKNNYKFIHITTDCVYDGLKGDYSVNDTHSAKNIYGISKSQGEPEEATIIRTSIIGEELTGKKSLIEWVKSNKDGKIKGYTNHFWNGVTCLPLANLIKNIIDSNDFWKGVKHIFSPDKVSKYDLCCYINEIYGLNINIEKYEDSISKNMTLIGEFKIKEPIFEQILKLKEFNLVI